MRSYSSYTYVARWGLGKGSEQRRRGESEKTDCSCLSVYLFIYRSTVFLLDRGRFFSFLILYTVGRTPSTGDQPVARLLPTHRTQTQNKFAQTSMPSVEFEPTIPAFERAKTVHALDRAATAIRLFLGQHYISQKKQTG
jgi:hypothetical protein